MLQKKNRKICLAGMFILLIAIMFPCLSALSAEDDGISLMSVRAGYVTNTMPNGGNSITFAEVFAIGSQPSFSLHFDGNVTRDEYYGGNISRITIYNEKGDAVTCNYSAIPSTTIVVSPGVPLAKGMYSIVVEAGVSSNNGVTNKAYTVYFMIGEVDPGPPYNPTGPTQLVRFIVSGVLDTQYFVYIRDANGVVQNSVSGIFLLPDGRYYYAVTASGHKTEEGYITVNGKDLTEYVTMRSGVTISFEVTPANATVMLKFGQNEYVEPIGHNTFRVQPGLEYAYVIELEGYITRSTRVYPIDDMTIREDLVPGQDGQGYLGGNTLTMLSPDAYTEITLGKRSASGGRYPSGYFYNVINKSYSTSSPIIFGFTLGAGVNSFNEPFFLGENMPLINIYDGYPNGKVVPGLGYSGYSGGSGEGDPATIFLRINAGALVPGKYYLVFDRDVSGNNPNKTLGCDIVFEFTVTDSNVPAIIPGDVNGDGVVDIFDVRRILDHISGINPLTGNALIAADMSGDGEIDIFDVRRILDHISGIN